MWSRYAFGYRLGLLDHLWMTEFLNNFPMAPRKAWSKILEANRHCFSAHQGFSFPLICHGQSKPPLCFHLQCGSLFFHSGNDRAGTETTYLPARCKTCECDRIAGVGLYLAQKASRMAG